MANQQDWSSLSHTDRILALQQSSLDQLVTDYKVPGDTADDRKLFLQREQTRWLPNNVQEFKTAGGPPTKDVVLGAYRDLDRAEAILELIDNSIDAWMNR